MTFLESDCLSILFTAHQSHFLLPVKCPWEGIAHCDVSLNFHYCQLEVKHKNLFTLLMWSCHQVLIKQNLYCQLACSSSSHSWFVLCSSFFVLLSQLKGCWLVLWNDVHFERCKWEVFMWPVWNVRLIVSNPAELRVYFWAGACQRCIYP